MKIKWPIRWREVTLPWLVTALVAAVAAVGALQFFSSAVYLDLSEHWQALVGVFWLAIVFPLVVLIAPAISALICTLLMSNFQGDVFLQSTQHEGRIANGIHVATRLGKALRHSIGLG